jgi:predicted dehydrogenase
MAERFRPSAGKEEDMARLRMAVIGVGHLGKEHARILAGLPEVELVGVADVNEDQARVVAQRCQTSAFGAYWPLLNLVDAACIAVPTVYHHAIAGEFLRRGIPLLVEKPLAGTLEHAQELVDLAHQHQTILQVGHIERFNPAFEALKQRIIHPKFVECERLGPYTGRSLDIGATLDLMIHDLDILLSLVRAPLRSVDAIGTTIFGGHEDVVNARLVFSNGCVANLTASRASPRPLRQTRIWAPEGYASIDFAQRRLTLIQPSDQFLQLDLSRPRPHDVRFDTHFQVRTVDGAKCDQLTCELQDFVQCVQNGSRPRVSGEDGLEAISVAARILECVRTHQWDGTAQGPIGPTQLPRPTGRLFQANDDELAA